MRRSARLAKKQGNLKPQAPFCPYKAGIFNDPYHDERLRENLPGRCKYCQPSQDETTVEDSKVSKLKSPKLRRSARIKASGIPVNSADTKHAQIEAKVIAVESANTKDDRQLQCSICNKKFGHKRNLRRHVQKVHEKKGRHQCESCFVTFSRKEHLKRHNCQKHTSDDAPNHKCDVCHKHFSRKDALMRHKKQVHDNEKFKCLWCEAEFSQWTKMNEHIEKKHFCPSDSSGSMDAKSDTSNEAESSDPGEGHSRWVKRKIYKKNVEYKGGLPPHRWDDKCPDCGKQFSFRAERDRHAKEVHSQHERVKCLDCDKTFARRRHMITHHRKIHSDEPKSFKCDMCPKLFSRPVYLIGHKKRVHNWDNECPLCGKEFLWINEKKRHIREVHSKEGRVKCPECDKSFTRQGELDRHHGQAHASNAHAFECNICEKSFNRKDNLNRHISQVHNEERFECDECPAQFTQKSKMGKHMEKGEHHYELYCEHCNQVIVFKSVKAERRHFTTVGYWNNPSCTNAIKRLPLGRTPSEEERLALIEEREQAERDETTRRIAYNRYPYAKDMGGFQGSFEEYVKKCLDKEHERVRRLREKERWEEENEYDCPKSMLDPLTVGPRKSAKAMHDPIQNKICGHTFERSSLTQWFEDGIAEGYERRLCPFNQDPKKWDPIRCINDSFCLSDMEQNVKMKAEIDRRKARKRREKANILTDEDKEELRKEQDERDQEAKMLWDARVARMNLVMEEKKKKTKKC